MKRRSASMLETSTMSVSNKADVDIARAEQIWAEYQKKHDVSKQKGQTVGIDPRTGSLWFGDSIQDVVSQRNSDGNDAPLFFIRVGYPTYYRKGRR
jgi:hypothetical protein